MCLETKSAIEMERLDVAGTAIRALLESSRVDREQRRESCAFPAWSLMSTGYGASLGSCACKEGPPLVIVLQLHQVPSPEY